MVGKLLMENALADANVTEIVNLVRRPSSFHSPKIIELVVTDFSDLSPYEKSFTDIYAAFFCIGVYTVQVPDDIFREITVDYSVGFAKALQAEIDRLVMRQGHVRRDRARFQARAKEWVKDHLADPANLT